MTNSSHPQSPYRILLPVSHPDTVVQLAVLAAALAGSREGEVIVLYITRQPGERDLSRLEDWPVVNRAVEIIEETSVPVDFQVREEASIGQAMRRAAIKTRADLLLIGWRGSDLPAKRAGAVMDAVLESPPCDVVVLGGTSLGLLKRFLVPISGGPNAGRALDLALGLAEQRDGQVTACHVCTPEDCTESVMREAEERLRWTLGDRADHPQIRIKAISASSAPQGIVEEAAHGYDLVWMGATQAAVIDSDLFGEIPRRVAKESGTTVAVTKRRAALVTRLMRWTWWHLFNFLPTLTVDERREVQREIYQGARPRIDFFLMIALSAIIASFGLLLDSPAVIIGAMLVAPLMSAVVGIGLGVVLGGAELLRKALWTTFLAMILAIVVAAITGFLVGVSDPTREVLIHSQPGLLDLGVALVSGAAGAYAVCRKGVSASLAGVAIAATLVPPLAVVGIGISVGRGDITSGAFLLFLTNLVAIASASGLIFLLLGFAPPSGQRARWAILRRGVVGEMVMLALIILILTLLTVRKQAEARETEAIYDAVMAQVEDMPGMQLTREDILVVSDTDDALELSITVRSPRQPAYQSVVDLQEGIATQLQRTVALKLIVIPTTELDPLLPPTLTNTPTSTVTPSPTTTGTPSPTSTPTHTPTHTPTSTSTPSPTHTPTHTPTETPTHTPTPTSTPTPTVTPTPTPIAASVSGTGYAGVLLREEPDGRVIGGLYENEQVEVYHHRQVVDGLEWALVRNQQGELGWVVTRYLDLP